MLSPYLYPLCNFQIIPDILAGLISLQSLNLSRNTLLALPPSIGCLTALTFLDASFNKLDSLPDTINNCW